MVCHVTFAMKRWKDLSYLEKVLFISTSVCIIVTELS